MMGSPSAEPDRLLCRAIEFGETRADASGGAHDRGHLLRVRLLALRIAAAEGADTRLVALAAALHDAFDHKITGSFEAGRTGVFNWLVQNGAELAMAEVVAEIVDGVSYRGDGVADSTLCLEGQCVRDADRLDAMGAIGIVRAVTFGVQNGRPIFDPKKLPAVGLRGDTYRAAGETVLNHFIEKLLHLCGRLETQSGREMGAAKHGLLVAFVRDLIHDLGSVDDLEEWRARLTEWEPHPTDGR